MHARVIFVTPQELMSENCTSVVPEQRSMSMSMEEASGTSNDFDGRDLDAFIDSINEDFSKLSGCLCRAAKDCSGGLGLFAARDICKGERVMVEVPFAAFPYQHSRPFTCASCLKDSRRFSGKDANAVMHDGWERRCQGCGVLRFCSEACEIALSARHSRECAALAKIAKFEGETMMPAAGPNGGDLLSHAIRVLADRQSGTRVQVYSGRTCGYDCHRTRLVGIERGVATSATIQQAVDVALHAMPMAARVPPAELFDVLSRLQCNSHAVCSEGGHTLARAAFVGSLNLFNHSCAPNVCFDSVPVPFTAEMTAVAGDADAAYSGSASSSAFAPTSVPTSVPTSAPASSPAFSIVSLSDVRSGTELCLSYVSTDVEVSKRREHLREQYGFDCSCERCRSEDCSAEDRNGQEAAYVYEAPPRCVHDQCGTGYMVGGRCVHCGRTVSG